MCVTILPAFIAVQSGCTYCRHSSGLNGKINTQVTCSLSQASRQQSGVKRTRQTRPIRSDTNEGPLGSHTANERVREREREKRT